MGMATTTAVGATERDYRELEERLRKRHLLGDCVLAADAIKALREENERLAKDDDQWRAAWDEMRDAVLNGRGPLDRVLFSDQTNAVLSVIDEAHDSYIDAALSAVPMEKGHE
jgi:hypothetical protein